MFKVSKTRIKELSNEFMQYETLREFVTKEIEQSAGERLSFFLDLRTTLDLAADAAQRCEGYLLNHGDSKSIDALAGFLR